MRSRLLWVGVCMSHPGSQCVGKLACFGAVLIWFELDVVVLLFIDQHLW